VQPGRVINLASIIAFAAGAITKESASARRIKTFFDFIQPPYVFFVVEILHEPTLPSFPENKGIINYFSSFAVNPNAPCAGKKKKPYVRLTLLPVKEALHAIIKCNYYARQLTGEEKQRGIFLSYFIAMKCSKEKI